MLVMMIEILCFPLAARVVGFEVYEFVNQEVTNGLLSFILIVVTFNLAVNWMGNFED